MRDQFPGYFPKSQTEKNEIWESCIFVFDANVLLNTYRYSDKSRQEFFELMEKLGDRLWIPHRVAYEFLKNRVSVIYEQVARYETATKSIEALVKSLEEKSKHPFVDAEEFEQFSAASSKLSDSLKSQAKAFKDKWHSDDVLNQLAYLLEGKVGSGFDEQQMDNLVEKGVERLEQKIPPGYKDSSKEDSSGKHKDAGRLGDFLIWEEVIAKASAENVPVIFVTDDVKEDWWMEFKGMRISPRPELVEEFKNRVSQPFDMYSSERFVTRANQVFSLNNTDELAAESKNIINTTIAKYKSAIEEEIADSFDDTSRSLDPEVIKKFSSLFSYNKRLGQEDKLSMMRLRVSELTDKVNNPKIFLLPELRSKLASDLNSISLELNYFSLMPSITPSEFHDLETRISLVEAYLL